MKKVILPALMLAFSVNVVAQNTNRKTETKTTTSTKKDATGMHQTVKKEVTNEVQKIELGPEKTNTINIPTVDSPVNVTTTTKITNPDGTIRTVDVDRSSYYESNGNKYKVELDERGYKMTMGDNKSALLRKTSTNSYIYQVDGRTAVSYFDVNGDLVVEIYDDKLDKVSTEKYRLVK